MTKTNHKIELAIAFLYLLLHFIIPSKGILIADVAIVLYLLIGKERRQKIKSIGFRRPINVWKTILACLFLGIVLELSFDAFLDPLIEKIINQKTDMSSYDYIRGDLADYLVLLIIGIVLGGFIEEIIFRGFLITRLSSLFRIEWLGNLIAIIVTSAAFGYGHLYYGWSGFISSGLFGVLMGLIFIKSNKMLWYSILIHGFSNVASLTLIFLNLDKGIYTLIFK